MPKKKKEETDIEIRELKNKDVWVVADIIVDVAEATDGEIRNLIQDLSSDDEAEKDDAEVGMEVMMFVLRNAVKNASDSLMEWFADLTDMSLEEFENADVTATLEVIEQIKEQEDVGRFFSRVSDLLSGLNE